MTRIDSPHLNAATDEPAPAGLGTAAYDSDRPAPADDQRGIADLLKQLGTESSHLVRQEFNLAKTELTEKASFYGTQAGKLGGGIGALAIGGLLLLFAVSYFIAALVLAVIPALGVPAAFGVGFTIVGASVAIVGYSLYSGAKAKMAQEPATPERTLQSLKDDKQWLTNKTTN